MATALYSDTSTHWQPALTEIVHGRPVRFSDVCVHKFYVGDTEDPEIYAAGLMWDWQHSPAGQWVIEHAVQQPYWVNHVDHYSHRFRIMARLSEQDQTFFKLKWGTQ